MGKWEDEAEVERALGACLCQPLVEAKDKYLGQTKLEQQRCLVLI